MSRSIDVNPIHLMQITDCHLFEQAGHRLMGIDTDESLGWVLELASSLQRPDRLLLTGDLAQDGSVAAYQRLHQQIARFNVPSSWICGNHDNPQHMAQAIMPSRMELQKRIVMGSWQVLMLHTQVDGEVGGYLEETELQLVEKSLRDFSGHSLICMHHHPLAINSKWMDRISIANADKLWDILRPVSNSVTLLSGHVHQDQEQIHQGVRVLTTPSSCFQFTPHSEEFGVTEEMPGLRTIQLYADGSLKSAVHRVADRAITIDRELMGY